MTSEPNSDRFAEARAAMVDSQLRPEGVADPAVLAALAAVPREAFVAEGLRPIAYSDRAIPLAVKRSLMPPAALAQLIQALAPRPGDRALIVGAGAGYSAAVLANMGVEVTALESDKALAELARGQEIAIVDGPLTAGHPADAPYDCILIDGAVEELPDAIIDQLADSGRLAAALAESGVTRLAVGTRSGSAFGMRSFADAAVSVLPGFFRASAFTF
jgi:protein-L-isoaspartate(D-aspartate) O-methyltransferase